MPHMTENVEKIVWKCQETRSEEEGFDSCKI